MKSIDKKGIDNRVSKAIVRALEQRFPANAGYVASKVYDLSGKSVEKALAFCVTFDVNLLSLIAYELGITIDELMITARVLNKI